MPQTSINSTCNCLAWPPNSNDHSLYSLCNKVIVSPLQLLIHLINYQTLIDAFIYSTVMDGASTRTRTCCMCNRTPTCLARARCGHAQVCFECTHELTSQGLHCTCPTCGDPFLGFPWNLLTYILESMRWELEMEVFLLNATHSDLKNPFILMRLGDAPLPPVPRLCARCKHDHAIFYNVDILLRQGHQIAFCGRCSIAFLAITDRLPLNPTDLITLD